MRMTVLWIVLLLVYLALVAWMMAAIAKKHSWLMALIRHGVLLLSLVIAVPVSKTLGLWIGRLITDTVIGALPNSMADYFEAVSLGESSLAAIIGLVLGLCLFVTIFLFVRLLLSLLVKIPEKVIPALHKERKHNRVIACSIGALNGVVLALVTLIPLCGLITTAVDTSAAFFEDTYVDKTNIMMELKAGEGGDVLEAVEDATDELDHGAFRALSTIGSPVYRWLTTTQLAVDDGRADHTIEFDLDRELVHLGKTAGQIVCAADTFDGDFSEDDKAELLAAGDTLLDSSWVAELGAETLSYAGNRWKNGRQAWGQSAPTINATMQPTMLVVYDILSTESSANIRADLRTMLDVLGTLAANGFFDDGVDSETLLSRLAEQSDDGNLVDRLQAILEKNQHLSALSAEIDAVIARVVSSVLSTELRENDRYTPAIQQVSGNLNQALAIEDEEERHEVVRSAVKDAFETEGINIPEDLALEMSDEIMAECGDDGEITDDEVREYLATRMENDDGTIQQIIDNNDLSAFLNS